MLYIYIRHCIQGLLLERAFCSDKIPLSSSVGILRYPELSDILLVERVIVNDFRPRISGFQFDFIKALFIFGRQICGNCFTGTQKASTKRSIHISEFDSLFYSTSFSLSTSSNRLPLRQTTAFRNSSPSIIPSGFENRHFLSGVFQSTMYT